MIVLDTHALVWWLSDSSKLTTAAKKAIRTSVADKAILISTASILEIATLVRRQRLVLTMELDEWLDDINKLPELKILPITTEIAARAGSFGSEVHGDPIDRLIVATALIEKAKLVTADTNIRACKSVATIW